MKRLSVPVCALGLVALTAGSGGAQLQELRVGGEIWNRWEMRLNGLTAAALTNKDFARTNFASSLAARVVHSRMNVERGYLDIRPKFTDTLSGRFTLDFDNSIGTANPVSLSSPRVVTTVSITTQRVTVTNSVTNWRVVERVTISTSRSAVSASPSGWSRPRIKYAYLTWKTPVPDLEVEAGVTKTYFGSLYDWEYLTIEKDAVDRSGKAKSADASVALIYQLPLGYGQVAGQIAHGEGYASAANVHPAYIADLRLIPLPGITLGGAYRYQYVGNTTAPATRSQMTNYKNEHMYNALLRVDYGFVAFHLQYFEYNISRSGQQKDASYLSEVFWHSLLALRLRQFIDQDLELVGRVDYKRSTDASLWQGKPDGRISTHVGLNYGFAPNDRGQPQFLIQANWTRDQSEVGFGLPEAKACRLSGWNQAYDLFQLQLRWRFSATIKG